jgi:hypothetical protein
LRSSEDTSALTVTGAVLSNVRTSASVQHGDDYQNNTSLAFFSANTKNANVSSTETIHLAVIFCNVGQKAALKWNFKKMIRSLIKHSSNNIALYFHLVTDPSSWEIAKDIIHNESKKTQFNIQVRSLHNLG